LGHDSSTSYDANALCSYLLRFLAARNTAANPRCSLVRVHEATPARRRPDPTRPVHVPHSCRVSVTEQQLTQCNATSLVTADGRRRHCR